MRPSLTNEQQAKRMARGLALLAEGKSPAEVAARMGVTSRSVNRWRQAARSPARKKKNARPPGRPRRLSAKQVKRLEKELLRGAYAHGYAENYWTLERIGQLIWQLFGVRYHPSGVWHVMKRMGWSNQKPQRQPIQRDDRAIEAWKEEVWPVIKKVANPARHPGVRR